MAESACWVLTNSDGEDLDQDGIPHFASEQESAEYAARPGDYVLPDVLPGFKPRQLGHLCVTVACSCCGYVYDEDEDGIAHFDDMAEAEKALAGHWKFTRDEALCDECKPGMCDRSVDEHGGAEALFTLSEFDLASLASGTHGSDGEAPGRPPAKPLAGFGADSAPA